MNCKYCGAALPTQGGVCPECGKMIPISQQRDMRDMLDPRWNQYRNKDTALYKSASNGDAGDAKLGKTVMIIIGIIVLLIIFALIKKGH